MSPLSPAAAPYQSLSPRARRQFAVVVGLLHVVVLLGLGLSRTPVVQPGRIAERGLVWIETSAIAPAQPAPLPPMHLPKLPVPAVDVPPVPVPEIVAPPAPPVDRPVAPHVPAAHDAATSAALPAAPADPAAAIAIPRPVPPPPPPGPRTVAISAVEYLAPPQLQYPLASRRLREQGQVQVRLLVDEQGRPQQAAVVRSSGSERLDDAALQAARATRFKPYAEDGRPRPFWVVMPLLFELET